MLSFLEFDLKLDIIPITGLRTRCGVDAALLPDGGGVYVDEVSYVGLDTNPPWLSRRLRFTLAHEYAHLVLHRDSPSALRRSSIGDYELSLCNLDREIEREADEFAGQLLVPAEGLSAELAKRPLPNAIRTNPAARHYFAEQMAPRFGVIPLSVEIRLNREGIWPLP